MRGKNLTVFKAGKLYVNKKLHTKRELKPCNLHELFIITKMYDLYKVNLVYIFI